MSRNAPPMAPRRMVPTADRPAPPAPRGEPAACEPDTGAGAASDMAAVRALCWLRWREMTGRWPRAAALAIVCWVVGVGVASWWATRVSQGAEELMLAAAGGGWLAWAVAPLVGAGGNEVASVGRLAPYPVSERAVFYATWMSGSWDLPALLIGPLLVGCSVAFAGPAGVVVAALFVVVATASGQAGAWLGAWALAGRGWGAAALLGGGLAATIIAAVGVAGRADDAARVLPSGWVWNAAVAADRGRWGAAAGWAALLCAGGVAAAGIARFFHRRAVRAERDAAASTRKVAPSRRFPSSAAGALTVAVWRSVLRAPTTKVVLVSTLIAPLLARSAETGGTGGATMGTVMGIVALACGATLGVNVFAYAAGGATVVLAAPVRRWRVAAAHAAVLFSLTWMALLGTVAVAAVVGVANVDLRGSLGAVSTFAALVAGTSVWWSAKHPHAADHDSMRSRPAPGGSAIGFLARGAVVFSMAGWLSSVAPGVLVIAAGVVLTGGVAAAGRRLEREAERVAIGVGR